MRVRFKLASLGAPYGLVDYPAERPLWVSPAGVEEPARVYPAGRRVGGCHEEGKVLRGRLVMGLGPRRFVSPG